jgi:hypothetical protein
MKQIEELMAMTTHANGMSFEKAEFVHIYRNRVFLAQEYVRGRMVFGELVRVLESDSGTAFIEKVLTVIRTSATELEAMKKICGDYTCKLTKKTPTSFYLTIEVEYLFLFENKTTKFYLKKGDLYEKFN